MRTTGEPPIKPSRKQKKGSDKVEHPPKVEVEKDYDSCCAVI